MAAASMQFDSGTDGVRVTEALSAPNASASGTRKPSDSEFQQHERGMGVALLE
jgi:hypothetical protein